MIAPVVIGGVGGSGTRVVARMLQLAGFSIGPDLNEALDNATHVLLFTRPDVLELSDARFVQLAELFARAVHGRPLEAGDHELVREATAATYIERPGWIAGRAAAIASPDRPFVPDDGRWGWKVPDTHITLDRWLRVRPDLRYVHVVRHGLDMAYSVNQLQLKRWGHLFGAPPDPSPRAALSYWCAVQRRAHERAQRMGDRFLFVNYDRLCSEPDGEIEKLLRFIDAPRDAALRDAARAAIVPPPTIGRFARHDLSAFAPDDLRYVESLGFALQ